MGTVRDAVENSAKVAVTNRQTPDDVMSPRDMGNLVTAFPGLEDAARRIENALPEGWGENLNLEDLLASVSNKAMVAGGDRRVGMRTVWEAEDPAVIAFTAELFGIVSVMPEPDQHVIDQLSRQSGFEREGKIVAINGVPVPAGKEQVRVFANLRWRCLFSPLASLHLLGLRDVGLVDPIDHAELRVEPGHQPHRRHLLGYDAQHTTDETQQQLLAYSLAAHRKNLIALQTHDMELFMAVWLRDFRQIKSLVRSKDLGYLVAADRRTRRMQSASTRLIYGTGIMSEIERLFEIAEYFRMDGGVTREAIDRVIRSVSSMDAVHVGSTPSHEFVAGSVAHARSLYPCMNEFVANVSSDPALNQANAAFKQTASYWESPQRLKKPSGEMPALYFLGIEPQYLTTAAIIMMVRNLKQLEKNFTYRGSEESTADERNEPLVIRLGVVIMANACVPTAKGMIEYLGKGFKASQFEEDAWLRQKMPTLIHNPELIKQYDHQQAAYEDSPAGWSSSPTESIEFADEDHKSKFTSQYGKAKERADACPAVKKPGWTRCFHFQTWFTPTAEFNFLRKCCRFVQFCPYAKRRLEKWTVRGKARSLPNYTGSPNTTYTGLPRSHPVEHIQDRLRPIFEKLQYADRLQRRWTISERAMIDAFVTEVARVMPAVSPITVDPHLNESIVHPVGPIHQKFAAEAAWNSRAPTKKSRKIGV